MVSNFNPRQGETIEVTVLEPTLLTKKSKSANKSGEAMSSEPRSKDFGEHFFTFNGTSYKFFQFASPQVASLKKDLDQTNSQKEPSNLEKTATNQIEKALIAVPADLDPGIYELRADQDAVRLQVRAGLFPLQHIHLASAKNNFDTANGETEAVEKAKATLSDTRLWHGQFAAPSKARRSTGFGLKRVVNGRLLKDYFHSGLDYAGALGSPITACASGKVVLVGRNFKLHGNTVAIDHGQGVISFYIHMQKIAVKEGDAVKLGEKIGTVGQSGRATGPHLHFSIYVNKVAANPDDWFKTAF